MSQLVHQFSVVDDVDETPTTPATATTLTHSLSALDEVDEETKAEALRVGKYVLPEDHEHDELMFDKSLPRPEKQHQSIIEEPIELVSFHCDR